MIIVRAILFIWAAVIGYAVIDIGIPYALERFEERRWRKLHPGLPLSRRRA